MNKPFIFTFLTLLVFLYEGCSSLSPSINNPSYLIANSDSLLLANPEDDELRNAIVDARLSVAKSKNNLNEYKKVLQIDPKNRTAQYHIYMAEGITNHKKGHKNGQWDAIQSFAKAATALDTVGDPYYWMGLAYEKKDEMDFELPLESYDKALSLFLTNEVRTKVDSTREQLLKRKKTYEDFWK